MPNLLKLVYEYRRLVARRDLMQGDLSIASSERLVGLERLFGRDPDDDSGATAHRRRFARCELQMPATVRVGRRVQAVNVVNLGGGGLCVSPAPPLKPGERAVIRIVSPENDSIYHYPVQASWVQRSTANSAMGMPFVGAPRQLPLTA
jgi:hypothetical protein